MSTWSRTSLIGVVLALVLGAGACSSSPPVAAPGTAGPAPTASFGATPTDGTSSSATSPTSTTSAPTTTTTATPTPSSTTLTPHVLGSEVAFPQFTVRVDAAMVNEAQGYLVHARVCVTALPSGATVGKTRLSWDPWTVSVAGRGGVVRARLFDGSHPPTDLFANNGRYAIGECASGFIPFADLNGPAATIHYRNELGDEAEWRGN